MYITLAAWWHLSSNCATQNIQSQLSKSTVTVGIVSWIVPAFVLPERVRLASTASSTTPETPLIIAQTIVDIIPSETVAVADCILISAFIATVCIKFKNKMNKIWHACMCMSRLDVGTDIQHNGAKQWKNIELQRQHRRWLSRCWMWSSICYM